jgi:hypothetical protein
MANRERTTINIPHELKRNARAKAILEDKTLSQVVRQLLRGWVRGEIELPQQENEQEEHDR